MLRYFFLLIVLFPFVVVAQAPAGLSTKSKKAIELYTEADNFRVRGQFTQAIGLLNQAIDKDKNFFEAYYRLGIVYMSQKDFTTANQYLEKGLSLTSDPKKQKIFWYDLGESYFATGNYENAEKYMQGYVKEEATNRQKLERAKLILRNIQFAKENSKKASAYKQKKLSDTVNSYVLQYFPVLTADQQELIFTRRLGPGGSDDEDLVVSRRTATGSWSMPTSISNNINTGLNEGTCAISADGRKLIFTSCVGREGFGSCDLFESAKIGDVWSQPKNLGISVNSAEWESQPSLSADGRTLYFVSDRRGGLGRRDIWISTLNDKGQWTKAKNAGKPINTVYDEISPFIHVNNRTLYFASNGLTGFGGYDIFFSERDSATWSTPVNMGSPINTHEDQFSLFITADGKKGYYSHEEPRPAGYSVSFIYEIEIPEDQQVKFKSNYVKGIVRDKTTKKPLLAKIELINLKENETESLVESDSLSGKYLMILTQGAEYALYVNKKGYLFRSMNFNYSEVRDFQPITLDIELEKATEGTIAILQNIFFDVDKYELKDKSKTELQKISRFLTDNPLVRVEISGHTDNVGAPSYNKQLSEKRAQSVYQYLLDNGIDSKRLIPKGYGQERPVSSNETDEGKQANRRIEFKIIR
jgi:outer membrane protein OmpA-like peptidoglycan-associated protein/tetratricopeptide (TPR) repeat protein